MRKKISQDSVHLQDVGSTRAAVVDAIAGLVELRVWRSTSPYAATNDSDLKFTWAGSHSGCSARTDIDISVHARVRDRR
jgi:hypothetical protein